VSVAVSNGLSIVSEKRLCCVGLVGHEKYKLYILRRGSVYRGRAFMQPIMLPLWMMMVGLCLRVSGLAGIMIVVIQNMLLVSRKGDEDGS